MQATMARRKRYAQTDIISSPALVEAIIIIIIIIKPLTRPEGFVEGIQNQVKSTFRIFTSTLTKSGHLTKWAGLPASIGFLVITCFST